MPALRAARSARRRRQREPGLDDCAAVRLELAVDPLSRRRSSACRAPAPARAPAPRSRAERRHSAAPIARLTKTKPSALSPCSVGVDPREAEAPLVGNVDAADRRRLALDGSGHTPSASKMRTAAVGQRRGAIVEARLLRRCRAARASISAIVKPSCASASASVAPTRPPPHDGDDRTRARSGADASCGVHHIVLDLVGRPSAARRSALRSRPPSPRRRPRCARRCSTSASARPSMPAGM